MNTQTQNIVKDAAQRFLEKHSEDRVARHFTVLFLREMEIPQVQVGEMMEYTTRQIYNIEQQGTAGLLSSPNKGGRPRIFEGDRFEYLIEEIISHPESEIEALATQLFEKHNIEVCGATIERELSRRQLGRLGDLIQQKVKVEVERYQKSIPTSFAGAFLLLPLLLKEGFLEKAESAFRGLSNVTGVILLLFTLQLFGIRRLFHLEHLDDRGVAFLIGRPAIYTRQHIHKWLKKTRKAQVQTFYESTRPSQEEVKGQPLEVSLDEHVIARWTKKIKLSGTKHPTRGKPMKADKLFYSFDLIREKLLSFLPQRGNRTLAKVALPMLRDLIETYKPSQLRLTLDAGGCKGSTISRLVHMSYKLEDTLGLPLKWHIRGRAYPNLKRKWLEHIAHTPLKEVIHPDYEDKPQQKQRRFYVGETKTKIKGCSVPLRTILTSHTPNAGGEKGDDLYAIYTNDNTPPQKVATSFWNRQNHELCYRVMTNDLNLDALPKSYSLNAKPKQDKKPNFLSKGITLFGWIKAFAFNLIQDFKSQLPDKYHRLTLGTILLKFLRKNATLYINDDEILVVFDPFKEQNALRNYIQICNAQKVRLSWLNNRQLRFALSYPKRGYIPEMGFVP